ncbi:MAG: precorrin-6A/cobalt-precorrin-6A reductase [Paracoccaceae bacterium]|jgi:precorrin-6A/cobalt-precorrin-6A reductase
MVNDANTPRHLLLLAGSGEARVLAERLALQGQMRVTASLLTTPRSFGALAIPTRVGAFGGKDGQARYLRDQRITAVLDATHPFADRISAQTAEVCAELGLPYAQVLRPDWQPTAADHWQEVASEAAAAALLTSGQQVFTTTGRATLDGLVRNRAAQFFVRQMEPRNDEASRPNVTYISGKGPFSVADEIETLRALNIDVLVVKNSGGVPSRTKLDAARALGIKVILIARPPLLDVRRLETVKAALDWIDAL